MGRPVDVLAHLAVQRFNPTAPVPGLVDAWVERAEPRAARQGMNDNCTVLVRAGALISNCAPWAHPTLAALRCIRRAIAPAGADYKYASLR